MKYVLDELKKKEIISDEGVIDPYQLCTMLPLYR